MFPVSGSVLAEGTLHAPRLIAKKGSIYRRDGDFQKASSCPELNSIVL
jgi:hypothetical protein